LALAVPCTNIADHDCGRRAALAAIELLEAAGEDRELALAFGILGLSLNGAGDSAGAREALWRGAALGRRLDDPVSLALILLNLAQAAIWEERDTQTARTLMDETLSLGRRTGDTRAVAIATVGLGWVALIEADWPAAGQHFREANRLFHAIGDRAFANVAYSGLADVARGLGELDQAEALYQTVVGTWQQLGHRPGIARCLECLAFVAGAQERLTRAGQLYGAAEALRESLGALMMSDERAEYGQALAVLRARLGERAAEFQQAWEAGRQMGYDAAVELALAGQTDAQWAD
jgi:non-specific serine/threonine protein kinase